MAVISLVGIIVASYLTLYKMGIIGSLVCSSNAHISCETVNTSKYAFLMGAPVAAWGVAFYVTTFVVSMLSVQPRFEYDRRFAIGMALLSGWGVLFSAYLTYLELFVIHAICQWCVVSAILVTIMFGVAIWELVAGRNRSLNIQ